MTEEATARAARRVVAQSMLAVLICLAAGVAGALVWARWWTPPSGVAIRQEFVLDVQGAPVEFGGTAGYVIFALLAGVVAGILCGLLARDHELVALLVVLVGSVAAAVLMAAVGHWLGPPDPQQLARTAEDFSAVESDLRVRGVAPYFALPAGALLGLMGAFFIEAVVRGVSATPADPAASLGG